MIETNPYLFNAIAAFFIAFTSGWIVFAICSRQTRKLRRRVKELEKEMLVSHGEISQLEEQLFARHKSPTAPVISFNAARAGKTGK
jgi:hypothetical protein